MADTVTAVKDDTSITAPAADVVTAKEDLDSFELDPKDFKDTGDDSKADEGAVTDQDDTKEDKPSEEVKKGEAEDTVKDDTADTEKTDDKPAKGAEDRKQQLTGEIRDLVAQRNELRKQVETESAKVYQPQSVDDLKQTGLSDTDAKVEAMRQQMEIDKYNNQVAEAQLVLESEASRVITDFPIFNPDNKEAFNKDLYEAAAKLYDQNLIRNEETEKIDKDGNKIPGTGQVIGTHLSTYQLYKLINDAVTLGATNGEAKGAKAVKKAMASADVVSSGGPKSPNKKDKFEAAFDKVFGE